MADPRLSVLQVNSVDLGGGAAKIARSLFQALHDQGQHSWMAVGSKFSKDPRVLEIDHDPYRTGLPGLLGKVWKPFRKFEAYSSVLRTLHRRSLLAGDQKRIRNRLTGTEDFEFPGSAHLLELTPERPGILHFHNMHGDYFDLRELAALSQLVPVVVTLHDAWLLSGHCGHSYTCERWQIGCGECPDLTIPPPIRRDATASNWLQKKSVFSNSQLFIAAPCQWLMEKVSQSILRSAIIESRVIPHGVDLNVFQPADKNTARYKLGIPIDKKVMLVCTNGIHRNDFKDYEGLLRTLELLNNQTGGQKTLLIVLGEDGKPGNRGPVELQFVKYQADPKVVASYYQACDLVVHPAKADTFPTTVLEALACGKPVVASAVGGIPEQIEDGATGFLVSPGDDQAMAFRIEQLLNNDDLRQLMGTSAVESASRRFSLKRQVDDYLGWYRDIEKRHGSLPFKTHIRNRV